jgi:uncharacterized membrane protein
MKAAILSRALRHESDPFLARRRAIAALSLTAIGSMGLISLYQLGLITHLPEPPLPYFDADAVDAAPEAYQYLAMPDGVLGLASYAATLGLAAMGGPNRATEQPWIPLAMAAKVFLDTLPAARLTFDQWTKHRAFCFWCLLASMATAAMVPLVIPEARAALRTVQGTASLRQGAGALIGR